VSRVLQIRTAQVHAFREVFAARFIDDAVTHLLYHFPDPCASALGGPNEVRAFVTRAVNKASSLNVNTATAVTALLELWLQFGEDFQRSPIRTWTMNMLAHPDLPGAVKVDVIRDRHMELTGGCVMVVY
jgi:hypothetical protein